jgi:hypothetical protein
MVSSARSLLTWGRRRLGEELDDLETGLQADRICTGEQKVQREGLKARSTCFGLACKWCREPDLDRGMKRLGQNGISPHCSDCSQ